MEQDRPGCRLPPWLSLGQRALSNPPQEAGLLWALAFPRVAPASAPCAGQNTQEQLEGPRVCPYGDGAGCPHLHGFVRKQQRRCSFRWMNGTFSRLRS